MAIDECNDRLRKEKILGFAPLFDHHPWWAFLSSVQQSLGNMAKVGVGCCC